MRVQEPASGTRDARRLAAAQTHPPSGACGKMLSGASEGDGFALGGVEGLGSVEFRPSRTFRV
jgi:hypothetical protein